MNIFAFYEASIDTSLGTLNIGFWAPTASTLVPGLGTMLTLLLSIPPDSHPRPIVINTLRLAPSNYPLFVKPTTLVGVIPEMIGVGQINQRSDTLYFLAYSPVDLTITDPLGRWIRKDSTLIPNATYDDSTDLDNDGDRDDKVTIPNPLLGKYMVTVLPEADTGHYTLGIKIDGSDEAIIVTNALVPPPGQEDTFYYSVTEWLRGDPNKDGERTVADIVFLVNYLFKGGTAPDPLSLGDANCQGSNEFAVTVADAVYLVSYLFKGGPAPCS